MPSVNLDIQTDKHAKPKAQALSPLGRNSDESGMGARSSERDAGGRRIRVAEAGGWPAGRRGADVWGG